MKLITANIPSIILFLFAYLSLDKGWEGIGITAFVIGLLNIIVIKTEVTHKTEVKEEDDVKSGKSKFQQRLDDYMAKKN